MSSRHPRLQPFARGDVWALTADQAEAVDARAIDSLGVPQRVLMENAGRSAAAVLVRAVGGSRVLGIVGSGNNGGDALVALRSLAAWGIAVRAILVSDRDADDPLLHGWPLEVARDSDLDDSLWTDLLAWADVVVDGVLGTGARGAPRPRQAAAIERVNDAGCPVVALDVPSGIDASTGEVPGTAVRATLTVAFGVPKLGALLHPARALTGRHVAVDIGFPPSGGEGASARLVTPAWVSSRMPTRSTDTHKNRVGRVLIAGGAEGMAGAVILAARSAFAAGAGLVRVCSVGENREVLQSSVPEAIFVGSSDTDAVVDAAASSDVVAVGPGLGVDEQARATLRLLTDGGGPPLVLDADALNLVAEGVVDLVAIAASGRPVLITPHPGEMTRLEAARQDAPTAGTDATTRPGPDSPVVRAGRAAERFGCVVLLKGAPSVVATPGTPVALDTQGTSDLAVAGMGDTLTGVCAALLAQKRDSATAASLALYLSGRAAVLAGRGAGLTPSDVVRWLPEARREVVPADTDLGLPFVCFDAEAAR